MHHTRLNDAWPEHVSLNDVLEADPSVTTSGRRGTWYLLAALGATALWTIPLIWFADTPLPGWWQQLIAITGTFLTLALMLFTIVAASVALLEFLHPRLVTRKVRMRTFGLRIGLDFRGAQRGLKRHGILFGEIGGERSERGYLGNAYRGIMSIRTPTRYRTETPHMEIGVARRILSKGPYGPHRSMRYLTMQLPGNVPHLFITSAKTPSSTVMLPGTQRVSLEGDFDTHFTLYAPKGQDREAREILTPNVMAGLIDHGAAWDIEVSGNRLIVASPRSATRHDRDETIALLGFAETVAPDILRQSESFVRSVARDSASKELATTRLRWGMFDAGAVASLAALIATIATVVMSLT